MISRRKFIKSILGIGAGALIFPTKLLGSQVSKGDSSEGNIIWGQKTLQAKSSVLSKINARRIVCGVEKIHQNFLSTHFLEPNDSLTRTILYRNVEAYLNLLGERDIIKCYDVVCDETNNTPDVIDRNDIQVSWGFSFDGSTWYSCICSVKYVGKEIV